MLKKIDAYLPAAMIRDESGYEEFEDEYYLGIFDSLEKAKEYIKSIKEGEGYTGKFLPRNRIRGIEADDIYLTTCKAILDDETNEIYLYGGDRVNAELVSLSVSNYDFAKNVNNE